MSIDANLPLLERAIEELQARHEDLIAELSRLRRLRTAIKNGDEAARMRILEEAGFEFVPGAKA